MSAYPHNVPPGVRAVPDRDALSEAAAVLVAGGLSEHESRRLARAMARAVAAGLGGAAPSPAEAGILNATQTPESVKLSTRFEKDRERGGAGPSRDMLQP